jgi:3'-phosphoadenosine 5'-phosphosulfate sulfotransferase (PAPS reductase)/FAD synthetase
MEPKHIVSWSGGKDSTAMLVRMLELKMPVDVAVFAETSYEFAAMYDFHKTFRNWMAKYHPEVKMMEVCTDATWDHWFHGPISRGKRKGDTRGWPLLCFPCWWSRESKFKQLDKVCKGNIRYIGYAADEKKRLAGDAMKDDSYQSPLGDWGWSEKDCLEYLESKGLAVQLHRDFNRTGCFMCPKQPRKSLEIMCKLYPKEWARSIAMEQSNPTKFHPEYSLKDVEDALHDKLIVENKSISEIDLDDIIANAKESSCCTDCDLFI